MYDYVLTKKIAYITKAQTCHLSLNSVHIELLIHFNLYSVHLMKWLSFLPCTWFILYFSLLDWMWSVFCYWKWDCCQIRLSPVPSMLCSLFIFQPNRERRANRLKNCKMAFTWTTNPELRSKFPLLYVFRYLSKETHWAHLHCRFKYLGIYFNIAPGQLKKILYSYYTSHIAVFSPSS